MLGAGGGREVLLSHKSVSPIPGAKPCEQHAQFGVTLALGFLLLRSLLLGGFFGVFPLWLVVREIVCFVQSSVGIGLSICWNIFVLGESSLSNARSQKY